MKHDRRDVDINVRVVYLQYITQSGIEYASLLPPLLTCRYNQEFSHLDNVKGHRQRNAIQLERDSVRA